MSIKTKYDAMADSIQEYVLKGKIHLEDFPDLIREGLDEKAVERWKELFGAKLSELKFATKEARDELRQKIQSEKHRYFDKEDGQSNIHLDLTLTQIRELYRAAHVSDVSYGMVCAEFTTQTGRKVTVRLIAEK